MEGWVKRVKHVGNEEEASESTSNDAIVVLVGQSVGGHARLGASERTREGIRTEGGGGMIGEVGAGVGSCGAVGGSV